MSDEHPVPPPPPVRRPRRDMPIPKMAAQIADANKFPAELEPHKPINPPEAYLTNVQLQRMRLLISEYGNRMCEALRLYEPLPEQERFHKSQAKERVIIGGNRSGKTLSAAIEVARAVTGQDPYGKYPKENGRCYCVGDNEKHIGQTMWRKLGRSDPVFKMIRDASGVWRAYRPWNEWDRLNYDKAKGMPPLIPPRMIETIAWSNKKENIPTIVRLKNGWELCFFASGAPPQQGADVDLVWMDEEIRNEGWYSEMSARLLDRHGRFLWSATPKVATQQLFQLYERAEDGEQGVEGFLMPLTDNPHISDAEKLEFAAKLNDDQRRVLIYGEFALNRMRVYPEFSMDIHGCDAFSVPEDWCKYVIVDPGRQVCAVLFAAVPPDEEHVYLYDELYIKSCSAEIFGQRMEDKLGRNNHTSEAFIIDGHEGMKRDVGGGLNIEWQYSEQLASRKITCRRTGSGFLWGSDNTEAGISSVRSWLHIRPNGKPYLQVMRGRLPNFEWEIKRYNYVPDQKTGLPTDKPIKKMDHMMDNLRYLAAFDPSYVRPVRVAKAESNAVKMLRQLDKLHGGGKKKGGYIRLGV